MKYIVVFAFLKQLSVALHVADSGGFANVIECQQHLNITSYDEAKDISNSMLTQFADNVFLVWTTPADTFQGQHAFTLESLFKHNPSAKVKVYSDSLAEIIGTQPVSGSVERIGKLMKQGFDLQILQIPREDVSHYIDLAKVASSKFAFSHLTDAVRTYAVHTYGGVYMDFDVITVNAWTGLPPNFLHYQRAPQDLRTAPQKVIEPEFQTYWDIIQDGEAVIVRHSEDKQVVEEDFEEEPFSFNTAFMRFEKGHPYVKRVLGSYGNYDPNNWLSIGHPLWLQQMKAMVEGGIDPNFVVLPQYMAAPIHWTRVNDCAHANADCTPCCTVNRERGVVFHYYNHVNKGRAIASKDSCMGQLFQE